MRLTVLGCGTSTGVPVIGCSCPVCRSTDPRDRRLRTSLLIEEGSRRLVIDSGPDFRAQALRQALDTVDGVLYTHGHADHVLGLDDLRPLSFRRGIDIWAEKNVLEQLNRMFPYAFVPGDGMNSRPKLREHVIQEGERFEASGFEILPLRVVHGKDSILGFRVGRAAWITDCNEIPQVSQDLLKGLDVLFLDGLQERSHPTHFNFEQAVVMAQKLGAGQTYLIHIGHEIRYKDLLKRLPAGIEPAWDGLTWEDKKAKKNRL
ncbi:MAG: MBL fold metallo-hydrolase [Spirochaetales bacterium]|nr:MBL fold metallo-hydrolase [Spirochaetales bacterium]